MLRNGNLSSAATIPDRSQHVSRLDVRRLRAGRLVCELAGVRLRPGASQLEG